MMGLGTSTGICIPTVISAQLPIQALIRRQWPSHKNSLKSGVAFLVFATCAPDRITHCVAVRPLGHRLSAMLSRSRSELGSNLQVLILLSVAQP